MALPRRNRMVAIAEALTLQWANGKAEVRQTPGQGRFTTGHVGFYVEAGKSSEFDAFALKYKLPQIEIRHTRHEGPAEVVTHWNLGEAVGLVPIMSGPVATSVAASLANPTIHRQTADAGIGLRWGREEGERSKMAIRGYLVIEAQGQRRMFPHPMQVTARSRMTDKLMTALVSHMDVCGRADALWNRNIETNPVGCYEILLPLGAGPDDEWGKGSDKTTVTPFESKHPGIADVDLDYLERMKCSDTVLSVVERDWQGVRAWAEQFSFPVQQEHAENVEVAEI